MRNASLFDGDALRSLRAVAGLNHDDIADGLGTEPEDVGRWERGESEPSYSQALALTRLLSCDYDYLGVASSDREPARVRP